jgi:hypothetical protein
MGAIDDLSKDVKEYTTIYSDVLIGLHNDMKSTLKEMSTLKTETTSAIKELNIVSAQTNKMISLNKQTEEEIYEFNVQLENEKEDIIYRQQTVESLINENQNFIKKSLITISGIEKKVTDDYYLLLDKSNNLEIEMASFDKYLSDLNDKNIELNKKIIQQEKEFEKRNKIISIHMTITYLLLTILTSAICYHYIK